MEAGQFDLSKFLPYRLAVLSERVSKRLSHYYTDRFGLSVAEWRVIVHLSRCKQVSVREIHNCVNLEKSRVSRAVTRLEGSGLVQKLESEKDLRLLDISLTAKGWDVLQEIVPQALSFEQELVNALSAAESETLIDVMEKLHSVLDEDPLARKRSQADLIAE